VFAVAVEVTASAEGEWVHEKKLIRPRRRREWPRHLAGGLSRTPSAAMPPLPTTDRPPLLRREGAPEGSVCGAGPLSDGSMVTSWMRELPRHGRCR
jgi:hypothetical protein